ncbi:MAG: restriction endonuclease subunit S [Alphaproteobacteria bacterium]|nr:restriction endonuclease subunit S [Alphaproteobacteria bacterium]
MQSDKYSRDNAGQSLKKYTLLKKGELAYNHGASKYKPYGCCFELTVDEARIPYVYHCFSLHNSCIPYVARLLNNQKIDQQLKKLISSSVRMDGLLNIAYEDYTGIDLFLPTLPEQEKIAAFLSLVDARIEKQRQLVEALKKYKRGYFQRIISNLDTSEYLISDIVEEYNKKTKIQHEYPILSSTMSGIKLQNDYFNKQAASEDTVGYKIVPNGYFTYRSMSDTGEFHFNLQDVIENGIVSPAYPVFKVVGNNSEFVEYILNETDEIKSQLLIKKEGGTRYALSFSKFKSLRISLPSHDIQDQFVKQLNLIDKTLNIAVNTYENLQKMKKGFLQQMFI